MPCDKKMEAIANASKQSQLRLEGLATNDIWSIEDGPNTHPIGLRLDAGDSGVVYLSKKQAIEVIKSLALHVFKQWDYIPVEKEVK